MLINAITFDIHNFTTHTDNSYMVENTPTNFELIAMQKNTRQIEITQEFDFDFAQRECEPRFIEFGNAVLDSLEENANVMDIDDVDEMVGTF